jgi:hypothetical protein
MCGMIARDARDHFGREPYPLEHGGRRRARCRALPAGDVRARRQYSGCLTVEGSDDDALANDARK